MAIYIDDFNRADETLTTPWATVVGPGCAIVSNTVKRASGAGRGISALTGESFNNDQTAKVTISARNDFDFVGVGVRWDASANGYFMLAHLGDSRVYLYRYDTGTPTTVGSFISSNPVATDDIELGVVGATFTYYLNGVSQGTWTDATHSSGVPAVGFDPQSSNNSTVDDFTADGQVAAGPSLDDVGGNNTVVIGDTEAITYSNFTTAIEAATINDGGTATTSLTVSSAGATSADIQLASLSAWVNTKACPFTSTNQTSQQVTVTSTDEDPDETASRAVIFNPPSGYTVIETNSMTWPAPDGSILKGFASQPPANSQVIHPNGLTVTAAGIVSTDLTANQTCYFYNETTEEGSSFQFLIESEGTKAGISTGLTNGIKEAITRGGLI